MLLLALCIFCNVLLAIIFKGFANRGVNNLPAIVVNYATCVVVASLVLGKSAIPFNLLELPWFYWSLFLSILFIGGFNIMALSFQKSGVALTAIIQKMSLVLPSAFAIAFYGESAGILKILGIIAALVAIVLVNRPDKDTATKFSLTDPIIILPLLTLIISGAIEIVLFVVQAEGLVTDNLIQFVATSFGLAGLFGAIVTVVQVTSKKLKMTSKDVVGGIILGIPNFLTIYLLVYLLSQGWEGSVLFPVNSVSILVLTAVAGFILYRERINKAKVIGMVVGVLSIILISAS